MDMEVINLVDDDDDSVQLVFTPPVSPPPPAPTQPHSFQNLQQHASAPAPFNIPTLFINDNSDDLQITNPQQLPPIQFLAETAPPPVPPPPILDDSDEELRELYRQSILLPRDNTLPQKRPFPQHQSTSNSMWPAPRRTFPGSANQANQSVNGRDSGSAAELLGETIIVPLEVDPEILPDEGDSFINPSLYQGPAPTDNTEPEGSRKMQQLLELNQKSSDATKEMDTPLEMKSILMKHQRQALYWMVNRESEDNPPGHPRGGILADDQGFGKTVSLIALLLTNRPEATDGETPRWGNLIVSPTSVLNQWAAELKEHIAPQYRPRVLIYHGPNRPKNAKTLTDYDVVLTTYGTLTQEYPKILEKENGIVLKRRKQGNLFKINWFRVVLDEAQAIRNFRRETFKAAFTLNARRKWSLSGTPIQNTVNDIYSQFQFLGYHVTETYKEWELRYKRPLEGNRCNPSHFKRFQAILGVVLLRRAKHDKIDNKPVIELPPRNTTTLDLTFSKTEQQFYESQEERAITRLHREAGGSGNDFALALHIMMRLRQACGHPRLCLWDSDEAFHFSDDELDVVELRMKTKCMFTSLPEGVRNRLFNELGPEKPTPQTCPICISTIEGDSGVVTQCGHLFCTSDYEAWRQGNDTCPSCRANLAGDDDVMSLEGVRKEIHAIVRKRKREEAAVNPKNEDEIQRNVPKAEPLTLGIQRVKPEAIILGGPSKVEPIALGGPSGKVEPMAPGGPSSKVEPIVLNLSGKSDPHEAGTPSKQEDVLSTTQANGDEQQSPTDERSTVADALEEDEISSPDSAEEDTDKWASKLKTSTKIKKFMLEYRKIHDETDDKVLCFSQWTRMLDLVEQSIRDQGYEFARLDGKMSTKRREEHVRTFKTRSKCRLFLISLTAGSTGLNLTVANRVFLLDSWWNPAVENQAIDRVHRIGQKKAVEVIKLKIGGTIEERILALQDRKRQIIDGALGVEGLKTVGRQRLTMQDIMGLFQDVASNVANRAETGQNEVMANRAQEVLDMTRMLGAQDNGLGDRLV